MPTLSLHARTVPSRRRFGDHRFDAIHRGAVLAAMRKAATLDRVDPCGDAYGAAGQALEDYWRRNEEILAGGQDVTGWINTVIERRWINELRYQGRRSYERLDAPLCRDVATSLIDVVADARPGVEDLVEVHCLLDALALEQSQAIAYLRERRVRERHVRIVELGLSGDRLHAQIAGVVNAEFPGQPPLLANSITKILLRQRDRLAATGRFPTVVVRLQRTNRAN